MNKRVNDFKVKKIRRGTPRKPLSSTAKKNITTAITLLLVFVTVYYAAASLLKAMSGSRLLGAITTVIGKELETDQHGHTNILLVGVGGEGHEGADLTDTIILASVDKVTNEVALFSIPRDLYVESSLGGSRVNRLYEKGKLKWGDKLGLEFLRATLSQVLDVPLHYMARVDFEAFVEAVDALGGVEIYNEYTIDDPEYPDDKTFGFEPFHLEKGLQKLDGKTALKYVRSRKSSSDFDRSRRQQQVLVALKKKLAEHSFSRQRLAKDLYASLRDHVYTSMSMREMLTMLDFMANFDEKNMTLAALNDEPGWTGGFLYTPLRELYGGAFVLLPAGDTFKSIQQYLSLVFYGPKKLGDYPVAILNGTKVPGLAGKAGEALYRFGFEVKRTANARTQDLAQTTWYVTTPEARAVADSLATFIPGAISTELPIEYMEDPKFAGMKIILELGADATEAVESFDIFKNVIQLIPSNAPQPPLPASL